MYQLAPTGGQVLDVHNAVDHAHRHRLRPVPLPPERRAVRYPFQGPEIILPVLRRLLSSRGSTAWQCDRAAVVYGFYTNWSHLLSDAEYGDQRVLRPASRERYAEQICAVSHRSRSGVSQSECLALLPSHQSPAGAGTALRVRSGRSPAGPRRVRRCSSLRDDGGSHEACSARGPATLALALLAAPLAAEAQLQGRVYRVGWLHPLPIPPGRKGSGQGLREFGYVEGTDLVIERQWGGGVNRLPAMAAHLVQLNVDVIIAGNSRAGEGGEGRDDELPIVMTATNNPVATSFVASLARPGSNPRDCPAWVTSDPSS